FSLGIGTTGSKVPCLSLIHARAASKPDAMPVPLQVWADTRPEAHTRASVSTSSEWLRLFISGLLAFAFMDLI
ncbi:MAG TPA: hypothetical protein VG274_01145, partial [Rhizomicrobium sp.]|nr:hypothetical protein [Rhizomicrobium sp.]